MAIALRIIAVLCGVFIFYMLLHTTEKRHLARKKLEAFVALLPKEGFLLIREVKGGEYVRGFYINDSTPSVHNHNILLFGYDVSPASPKKSKNKTLNTINIMEELVLNDLVDAKYLDEVETTKDDTMSERKKKKGTR